MMAALSLFPCLLLVLVGTLTATAAQVTNFYCLGNTTAQFSSSLHAALSSLWAASSASKSSNASVSPIEALYFCRLDLPLAACHACVSNATASVTRSCPAYTEAVVWYEHCTLRYAARPIIGHVDATGARKSPYFWQWGGGKVFLATPDYNRTLQATLGGVVNRAASNASHFATGEGVFSQYQKVRCLAQCSPDISAGDCAICLKAALNLTQIHCLGASWGMAFEADCVIRFGVAPFYSEGNTSTSISTSPLTAGGGGSGGLGSSVSASASSVMSFHDHGTRRLLLGTLLALFCVLLFDVM